MLISAPELHERLLTQPERTVVFDCRFRLGQATAGLEQYLEAHIPGAWFLDLEKDLSDPVGNHGGRHPLPNSRTLADKLGSAGVTTGTLAVVYDDGDGMAPHAWWLLRYLGHAEVRVLNGGLSAWKKGGYDLSDELPTPRLQVFPLNLQQDFVVSVQEVQEMVSGKRTGLLVDARAAERYRGEVEPLDPKAGHIPGATNAPWMESFSADGEWKSAPEQELRFQGLPPDGPVVAYCGSGVTACVNVLALALAGFSNVKLYAGSWSDWCSYDTLPVAVGDEA